MSLPLSLGFILPHSPSSKASLAAATALSTSLIWARDTSQMACRTHTGQTRKLKMALIKLLKILSHEDHVASNPDEITFSGGKRTSLFCCFPLNLVKISFKQTVALFLTIIICWSLKTGDFNICNPKMNQQLQLPSSVEKINGCFSL